MPADTEEILGTVQSLKQARRQLDEMVDAANLQPAGYGEFSLNYQAKDGSVYTIVKKGERQWTVVKRR